jgi:hypothetical protein
LISGNGNGTILVSIPSRRGYKEALRTLRFRCAVVWNISRNGATFTQRAQRFAEKPSVSSPHLQSVFTWSGKKEDRRYGNERFFVGRLLNAKQ